MGAMTGGIETLRSHPLTVADLESTPNDGRRYELIDGMLFVSPVPKPIHQRMAFQVGVALNAACPAGLEVLVAPLDVQTAEDSVVQPDVLVARLEDFTEKNLPVAPLLAVEVISHSSRLYDRNTKMAHYARMGAPSYWLLDPADPRIEIYELGDDGSYTLTATAVGDHLVEVARPFAVTLCPARLVDPRRST